MSPGAVYSCVGNVRQPALAVRAAAIVLAAVSLGACSAIGLPVDEVAVNHATVLSGTGPTLAKAVIADTVDPSDWEAVRRTIAEVPVDKSADGLDWSNPDTGSAGSLSALGPGAQRSGAFCRSFVTTINDFRGIRRYRGEACERSDGRWQLFGTVADDAAIS